MMSARFVLFNDAYSTSCLYGLNGRNVMKYRLRSKQAKPVVTVTEFTWRN